ncbi:MAG: GntR family transcriptional regulator [Rubrobacteraceae bacterium]
MRLKRAVLRDQIKEVLLERILEGEYEPGDRLVETQIAQELGISQTPVREALRELEILRFVTSEPFKGTRVRQVSREEILEIYPVRAALEEVAARSAAARLSSRVDDLEAEFEGMLRAVDAGDFHRQVRHDVRFHRLIVEASGNQTLLDLWSSLHIEARTLITFLRADIDLRELAETHRPVIEALRSGDPGESGRILREHLEWFGALIQDSMEDVGDDAK